MQTIKDAIWCNNPGLLKDCLEEGVDPNTIFGSSPAVVWCALERGDQLLRLLLEFGADPDLAGDDGTTALMSVEDVAKATLLLQAGANVNLKDDIGATALMYAAKRGSADLCEKLIGSGANVDAVDLDHRTALSWCASCGDFPEIIELLLVNGADPSLSMRGNLSPEQCAELMKHTRALEVFRTFKRKTGL